MSVMSDHDIRKALGKDIVIEPFTENSLTPIGYDFTVGEYIYSLEHGLLEPQDGLFNLPPKSTVQILTRESLWVSGRVAGTFHSKVSLVSRGLSHISTTLDPGWYGPLLITLRNNMDNPIQLKTTDAFVTLVFFKVTTPTASDHFKPEFRKDILLSQLENQTQGYINKIQSVLGNPRALESFEKQVKEANRPMISKVLASARNKGFRELLISCGRSLTYIAMIIVASLGLYWNHVKFMFNNVNYDSQIISSQFATLLALVSIAIASRRQSHCSTSAKTGQKPAGQAYGRWDFRS